ncbi:hypothetical protein BH10ACT3_BH10ACT3_11730 [soil metagenome]
MDGPARPGSRSRSEPSRKVIEPTALEVGQDAALMLLVTARMVSARIVADLAAEGFDDTRESDGYVFQRLQSGPVSVSELAGHLGITQQGASKSIADLVRRGYVSRRASPDDARIRKVELTDRGWAVIDAARRARADVGAEIDERVGPRNAAGFRRTLVGLAEALGGFEALERRAVPPPE